MSTLVVSRTQIYQSNVVNIMKIKPLAAQDQNRFDCFCNALLLIDVMMRSEMDTLR